VAQCLAQRGRQLVSVGGGLLGVLEQVDDEPLG
jgi:hypothetical protein